MVRPGATTRNPRVNRLLLGRRTALTVCQAMSIAITVVLPAPVASFSAKRVSSGLASRLALFRLARSGRTAPPHLWSDFREPDDGLCRLDLAEEGS